MLAARPQIVRRKPNRGTKVRMASVPAPVGGWNARDSLAEMDPKDAVLLDNWFPAQGQCEMRAGYTSHATGMGTNVQTLGEFNAGSARKMFAAANGHIWDCTAAAAATSLASGFSNDKWQWAQFDDATGGARVGLVNGEDAPQIYNGSTVAAMTISGSGLTTTTLDGIFIFKGRSYFWSTADQDFWYSATGALGGSLTNFPLGRVTGSGGNLICVGSWSRDAGDGQDDLIAFILSSGDCLVYQGSNPGDSTDWALIGAFKIGAPLGIRAAVKVGGDLIIITRDGYVSLGQMMATGRNESKAISDKIRKAVLSAADLYSGNWGWQALLYPAKNMGIFNVPLSATTFQQHVINTLTGAWCRFKGINAQTFALYNDELYFGGAGVVYKALTGQDDNGDPITAKGQTAWNYLGSNVKKRFTGMRHLLELSGSLTFDAGLATDFSLITGEPVESSDVVVASDWDDAVWDVASWSDESVISDQWIGADADGYNVSSQLTIVSSTRTANWLGTHYVYEPGRSTF